MPKKQFIKVADLNTEGLQTRAALNMDVVREYAEAEREGAVLPPLTVFADNAGRYHVGDGHHRIAAAKMNQREKVACEVRVGEFADALRYSLSSNAAHGLRRTNEDKKRAVLMAYERRKLLGLEDVPSARAIAEVVGVSDHFAGDQLRTVRSWAEAKERTGADGRTRSVPPTRPPAPPSDPPASTPPPTRSGPPTRPPEPAREAPAKRKVELPTDANGKTIPPGLIEVWNRRGEIAGLARQVSDVRCRLREAQEGKDPLYGMMNFSSAISKLDMAFKELTAALPWCVCHACQGLGCNACKGMGLLSEYRYEMVPKSIAGGEG